MHDRFITLSRANERIIIVAIIDIEHVLAVIVHAIFHIDNFEWSSTGNGYANNFFYLLDFYNCFVMN